jgi:hypothetical protein
VTGLTEARATVLKSARLSPPSAWIVDPKGGRIGWEGVSFKRNVEWLAAQGYLRANAHGDYTLTDLGEATRAELLGKGAGI